MPSCHAGDERRESGSEVLLENDLPVSHVMEAVKGPLIIRKG